MKHPLLTALEIMLGVEFHYSQLSKLLGCEPDLRFTQDPTVKILAAYFPDLDTIYVNLAFVHNPDDIPFIIAHEMRHAWQSANVDCEDPGNPLEMEPREYLLSRAEQDANAYALHYLRRFNGWSPPIVSDKMRETAIKALNKEPLPSDPAEWGFNPDKHGDAEKMYALYVACGLEDGPVMQWGIDQE